MRVARVRALVPLILPSVQRMELLAQAGALQRTFHAVLCGALPSPDMTFTGKVAGELCGTRCTVVTETPSNKLEVITTAVLAPRGRLLRHQCQLHAQAAGHAVMGNAPHMRKPKGLKLWGNCLAGRSVCFRHPFSGRVLEFVRPEPTKFATLRTREAKFYERRLKHRKSALAAAAAATPGGPAEEAGENVTGSAAKRARVDRALTSRIPVEYVTHQASFRGLALFVTEDVMVPRPGTEAVAQAVVDHCRGLTQPRVLDLGTGSGCILAATLCEVPCATGVVSGGVSGV